MVLVDMTVNIQYEMHHEVEASGLLRRIIWSVEKVEASGRGNPYLFHQCHSNLDRDMYHETETSGHLRRIIHLSKEYLFIPSNLDSDTYSFLSTVVQI